MDKYITLKKWQADHSFLSMSKIRRLIFERYTNGFDTVVRKIGGSWFVIDGEFDKWVDKTNRRDKQCL